MVNRIRNRQCRLQHLPGRLENGHYEEINSALIPTQGSTTQGASYDSTDTDVKNRKTCWYKLEDIDLGGNSTYMATSATPRLMFKVRK